MRAAGPAGPPRARDAFGRRVRLRRLDEWKDEDKPFRFEVLVDALQAQAGPGTPAPPPMHYSLQYSMPGVCVM